MSDFSEVAAFAADLTKAAATAQTKTPLLLRKTAMEIVAGAQQKAPVDTGTLRNSIGADVTATEAVIGPTVDYAPYVEFGTSRQAPQPYLHPAALAALPSFEAAILALGGDIG